jgi:hypothetical protein
MEQYKIGPAIVRIHGDYDLEKVKAATTQFLKKAEAQRKKVHREAIKEANQRAAQADPIEADEPG